MSKQFMGESWLGLTWSPWLPLDGAMDVFRESVPQLPGFYRVREPQVRKLVYIGQTGRDLRERTRALSIHAHRVDPPWNDPHTAAPGLWAWRREAGFEFELSVTPSDLDLARRQCMEDRLLFEYRLEAGESTLCNHGRFHSGWARPSNKKEARAMHKLAGQDNPAGNPSLRPPVYTEDPLSDGWLQLIWSPWISLSNFSDAPEEPGVYRLRDDDMVAYLGESKSLTKRLHSHSRKYRADHVRVSWVIMPGALPHELKERETDLIGAYYKARCEAPSYQYGIG